MLIENLSSYVLKRQLEPVVKLQSYTFKGSSAQLSGRIICVKMIWLESRYSKFSIVLFGPFTEMARLVDRW